eukprot:6728214-Prymnesium_polylepis.2
MALVPSCPLGQFTSVGGVPRSSEWTASMCASLTGPSLNETARDRKSLALSTLRAARRTAKRSMLAAESA